ncbi:hypothetical protein SAMN05216604_111138 [Pseudomonas agarici]|nr:hypothetical protein SAMN05216604_111138 [Pseudomonas agarici]
MVSIGFAGSGLHQRPTLSVPKPKAHTTTVGTIRPSQNKPS